jgi:hypothetical protein
MAQVSVSLNVVFKNPKAIRALTVAAKCLAEIGDDMPWRPEAKRAARALRYAVKHLQIEKSP